MIFHSYVSLPKGRDTPNNPKPLKILTLTGSVVERPIPVLVEFNPLKKIDRVYLNDMFLINITTNDEKQDQIRLLYCGFQPSKVVHDFFHPQYGTV